LSLDPYFTFHIKCSNKTLSKTFLEKADADKKETLEEFIYRRGKEMKLAEVNNAGVALSFKKRLKY
jgi:hypothetical protein